MAKIKLTKSAVDAAQPQAQAVELRDTLVPGFLCKITPSGRKVFMLQYRTNAGERRKPALGQYGELTVEQARSLAQEWLAQVRRGGDPGAAKAEARKAPTVEELCKKFMEDHSKKRNKPSTQLGYQRVIDRCIIPLLGRKKVQDVKRPDVAGLMEKLSYKPTEANKAFSILRKMFNLAEVWGYRPDGSNPCRHIQLFPAGKSTHLISDEDMGKLFRQLDKIEAEGLENYVIPLAIRLQFEFAGRRGEIVPLEWEWVDLENRRVVWPDSKTGGMSKPMGRAVPVERDQPGVVRQPLLRPGACIRRARRRASDLAGDTPMMAADSLRFIVPSGLSFRWPPPYRRACRASASAPHFALRLAQPSHVQASCLERARPRAVAAFAGVLAASSAAPPGRRCPERQRGAKAEGKIKGRGTWPLGNLVCTWGWRGTRQGAATCREGAQRRIGVGEGACFARWTATALDGAAP